MKFEKAYVPYGGYWSTPFTKWQGSLAGVHALELAAQAGKKFLAQRDIPASAFTGLTLGMTVPQRNALYASPWLAALIGADGITGPWIAQACATGTLDQPGDGKGKGTTVNFPIGGVEGDDLFVPLYGSLVRDIERRGGHLATGFVGTPYLLHVLTQHGRTDVAYDVLLNRTPPGWLYPVLQGATSIWERWDGWTEADGFHDPAMNSFNHCALGAVGEWLYSVLLGLDVDPDLAPTRNAYRSARIYPRPPLGAGFAAGAPIRQASGRLDTAFGRYEVAWELDSGEFRLDVTVPPNCRANVILPDDSSREVPAGRHAFVLEVALGDGIPVLRDVSSRSAETQVG